MVEKEWTRRHLPRLRVLPGKTYMPVSKYFSGHGSEVMSNMKKEYGDEKGERVFYATANKRGKTASRKKSRKSTRGASR